MPKEYMTSIRLCGGCVDRRENAVPITTTQHTFTCEIHGCNNRATCSVVKKGVRAM